jgi:hypothetical protein
MKNRVLCTGSVSALLIALLLSYAAKADGINLLRNGDFSQELQNWILPLQQGATLQKVMGAPFARAMVFETDETNKAGTTPPLGQKINASFKKGEVLTTKLWLRGTPGAKISAALETEGRVTLERVAQESLILTAQWQELKATGVCPRDFKAEELVFALRFAPDAETVYVGSVRVFKGSGESTVAVVSAPAPAPPKPQVQFQISGPDPHLPPSGGSSFDSSTLDPAPAKPVEPAKPKPSPHPLPVTAPAPSSAPPPKPTADPFANRPVKPKPTGLYAPLGQGDLLAQVPLAPPANAPDYTSHYPIGMRPLLPEHSRLVEIMPEDACGLLHNSDFAHNKGDGSRVFGAQLFGGWEVPDNASLKGQIVTAQAGPYTQALRLTVTPTAAERKAPYSLRMMQIAKTPPQRSDDLMLRVWMRSPDSTCIGISVDQHYDGCHVVVRKTVSLTPQWKEYQFHGKLLNDKLLRNVKPGAKDRIWTKFEVGNCPGTIELTGVCMTVEAPTTLYLK